MFLHGVVAKFLGLGWYPEQSRTPASQAVATLTKARDLLLLLFCNYVDRLRRGVDSKLVTELQM